jgi:hypothetical protein
MPCEKKFYEFNHVCLQQDVKNAHEKMRRQLSPASRQKVEEEK